MTDRLDRIETDLETVKEILLATARRAEATDKQIEGIALLVQEQSRLADERGRKVDERLDRLSENLNHLREDVDIAFQTISLLSENTDRSMAEFRAETRAIWEYLMRKSQNGDGNV